MTPAVVRFWGKAAKMAAVRTAGLPFLDKSLLAQAQVSLRDQPANTKT